MAEPGAPIDDFALPHGWDLGEQRFNDAKVDSAGRLWIGTIDRKLHRAIGHLYRVDARGPLAVAGGFALSNGMGWSPDGRSLFFAESFERLIHRFEFDPATGQAGPGSPLANLAGGAPKPDGITVDREGGIWCAIFGGGCVNRYLPDGRLDRSLRLPVSQPTSCMFGGPDLRTLFVTTASYGLSDAERAAQPLAGSLFAFDVGVQGRPEPLLNARFVLPGEFHE
jgi:L-arabinonolactonase